MEFNAICKVNGAVVSNGPVWSHGSVSAGGSHVANDGTGPQDPNDASPTSTYGRYGSLSFSTTLPVADGNVIECNLSGSRTDGSTPIDLPPVTVHVDVDTSGDAEGRAGNFDSGNRLDYQVHYRVTYSGP